MVKIVRDIRNIKIWVERAVKPESKEVFWKELALKDCNIIREEELYSSDGELEMARAVTKIINSKKKLS